MCRFKPHICAFTVTHREFPLPPGAVPAAWLPTPRTRAANTGQASEGKLSLCTPHTLVTQVTVLTLPGRFHPRCYTKQKGGAYMSVTACSLPLSRAPAGTPHSRPPPRCPAALPSAPSCSSCNIRQPAALGHGSWEQAMGRLLFVLPCAYLQMAVEAP